MKNLIFNKKSQSTLISHSLAIAMTVVLVLAVIVTFNNMRNQYQKFISEHEIKQVCLSVKGAVEEVYSPENYTSKTNSTMGKTRIELPKKIAGVNYYARFFNNSVTIGIDDLRLYQTCKIGFPAVFSGSSDGGPTYITWTRYANDSDEITMETI
jgi:hypothetical protein